jgi:hypothetical protein
MKRDEGLNYTEKGKREHLSQREYFINIFENCNLWIFIYPKFPRDGNESPKWIKLILKVTSVQL